MAKHGKKHRNILSQTPPGAVSIKDAVEFLRANPGAKFDETFDLAITLGIDPKKTEQTVRGTVNLPHGTGKSVKVLVFASGPAADAARAAGADFVGFEDMITKVNSGWTGFDVAISTTDAMKEVRKLGRVLGPRGLMPNPKTGTVTDDVASAVQQSKAGKVEFRMDKTAGVNVPFGKRSFEVEKLVENAEAILHAVRAEKPAGAKGMYLKKVFISTTMGAGIRVSVTD